MADGYFNNYMKYGNNINILLS